MSIDIADVLGDVLAGSEDRSTLGCPYCPRQGEDAEYVHVRSMMRLPGKEDDYKGEVLKIGDATVSMGVFPKWFRGSGVVLEFYGELCPHRWTETTAFHKGNTYRWVTRLPDWAVEDADQEARVWVDGACVPNPGSAGASAVAQLPDGRWVARWKHLGTATNNVAELHAIALGVQLAQENGCSRVVVQSDSRYAIGVLSGSMSAHSNAELVAALAQRVRMPGIQMEWAARCSNKGLETADSYANMAARDMASGEKAGRWKE